MPYALYTTVSNATPLLDPNISVTLSNQVLNNSTINTSRIFLDGNYLDTTGSGSNAALLINGVPITGGSASTATSSITANWANFPAISTITYATSAGTGGNIIMCNVSSLTANTGTLVSQVGQVTAMTCSTINGSPFPTSYNTILNGSQQMSGNQASIQLSLSGQPAGIYLFYVLVQSSADVMTAVAVGQFTGTNLYIGHLHCPNISPTGPTFNNYVSFQNNPPVQDPTCDIYVYSTTFPNQVVQYGAQRIL